MKSDNAAINSVDDGAIDNLRTFIAILQEWDARERSRKHQGKVRKMIERCLDEGVDSTSE